MMTTWLFAVLLAAPASVDGGPGQFPEDWLRDEGWEWQQSPFWTLEGREDLDAILADGGVPAEPERVDAGVPLDAALADERPRWPVGSLKIRLDHPRPGEAEKLSRLAGLPAGTMVTPDIARKMEVRLMSVGTFRNVTCSAKPVESPRRVDVTCGISTARVIDHYEIHGLPVQLLRKSLEKRIFLRPGERLDTADPRTADRVERQRRRVQDFLEQEGFFGGKVRVEAPTVPGDPRAAVVRIMIPKMYAVRVRDVEVTGVPPEHAGEIRAAVKGMPWTLFRPLTVRESLDEVEQRYRRGRHHPQTRIRFDYAVDEEARRADVRVTVRKGPLVMVRIDNDTPVATGDLQDVLTFAANGNVDEVEIQASADAIRLLLQERGYHDATIDVEQTEQDDSTLLTFHVHAHLHGYIRSVDIAGLRTLSAEAVKEDAGLASQKRGFVVAAARPPLWKSDLVVGNEGVYTFADVQQDERRIERYLVQQGFTEATVEGRVFADADGGVHVLFDVEEGPRYVLHGVILEGNKAVPAEELRRAVGLGAGSPFIPDALEDDSARLAQAYARRGYLQTRVQPLVAFDEAGRPTLKFVIEEGPRSTLKGIFLEGNRRTLDGVIRRELDLKEGTPLDPEAISAAVGRLRRSGVFRRISVRYLGLDEKRKDIFLVVQVEERPVRTLDGSFSVSTADYIGLTLEGRDRNAFGSMVDITGRATVGPLIVPSLLAPYVPQVDLTPKPVLQSIFGAQVGVRSRNLVQVSARLPRLLGTRFDLHASGSAELRDHPIPRPDPNAALRLAPPSAAADPKSLLSILLPQRRFYDQERYAQVNALTGIEAPFLTYWRWSLSYGFDLFARQLVPNPDVPWNLGFPTRAGWIENVLSYTRLDNIFDPQLGIAATGRLKLGARPLGSEGEFALGTLQVQGYYTWWRLTFAGSLRTVGAVVDGGAANKRIIPRRDLGIAGGDRSVRGYDQDAVRVQTRTLRAGIEPNNPRSIVNEPGLYSAVANVETRFTAVRGLWIGNLQLAGFMDAAIVTDTLPPNTINLRYRPTELGLSVGAGIRYVTPVGPLALDYGVDLLHFPAGRLHILFGYTF